MKIPVLLAILLLANGCMRTSVKELRLRYQSDIYARKLQCDGLEIGIRFLPTTMRLLNENKMADDLEITQGVLDSLEHEKRLGEEMVFVLNVLAGPDSATGRSRDLVYGGVTGYRDYRKSIEFFQIGLKKSVWIELAGAKISPASSFMENTFGLDPSRNFVLTFPQKPLGVCGKDLEFVIDGIIPGFPRKKVKWKIPMDAYEPNI